MTLTITDNHRRTTTAKMISSAAGATFIADTALPSDLGLNLHLQTYRANVPSENGYIGNEPCVIYAADKPPFGGGSSMDDDDNPWREQ